MVSILPSERSPWDVIGSQIGQNISSVLPGAVQQGMNRGQLQQSLDAIKNLSKDPNASPLDTLLAVMKAGAGIPGSEKYLGMLAPELVKFAEARRAQGIRQPGQEEVEPTAPRQQLPDFMQQAGQPSQNQLAQQTGQFFPSNIGAQQAPGNLPQAATTGQIIPLLTPSQKRKEANRLAEESTAAGIPLKPVDAMEEVNRTEEDKRVHNETVEDERKQRVTSQKEYGKKAVEQLKKVHVSSTPEQEAIFEKIGEDQARKGKSEADINRYLATEAKKFRNAIVNVEKDLSAPRIQKKAYRMSSGSDKDFQQAAADLRTTLKPILDLGLYDTARSLLQDKGYYPEETESIINPMSERQQIVMNRIPSHKKIGLEHAGPLFQTIPTSPANLKTIQSGLMDLKQADPNFSLVLARKAFEDKGYDWRSFKDALNDLEAQGFKLEDDQQAQRGYLDTPPQSNLQAILQGLKIIGR